MPPIVTAMRSDAVATLKSGRALSVDDLRRLFGGVQRFDAGVAGGAVRVGVWDRGATFGLGPKGLKEKDGDEVQFTADTFKAFVDNWEARKGPLPLSLDHASALGGLVPAPAAAFYDAFAVVQDGQVVHFKALGISKATPPVVSELAAEVQKFSTETDQRPTPDGLWGYRCEVTPLGQDPTQGLRNYKGLSPLFLMSGVDEQGDPVGPLMLDWSAVNVQFQPGCEVTMAALPTASGAPRAPAPARGARATTTSGAARAMGVGRMDETQMAAHFGWTTDDDTDEKKMAKVKMKMAALSAAPETPAEEAKEKKEEDRAITELRAMTALPEGNLPALVAALKAKTVDASAFGALQSEISALKDRLELVNTERAVVKATAFATQAIADGRTMDEKRSVITDAFVAAEKAKAESGATAAEPLLFAKGTFTLGRQFTAAGKPVNKPEEAPASDDDGSKLEAEYAAKADEIAKADKITFAAALPRVASAHPELAAKLRAFRAARAGA